MAVGFTKIIRDQQSLERRLGIFDQIKPQVASVIGRTVVEGKSQRFIHRRFGVCSGLIILEIDR